MRSIISTLMLLMTAVVTLASCPLNCKQYVPISLGYNCERTIYPQDVLHYPPAYCTYDIDIIDQYGNFIGNTVDASHIGQTLQVKVRHDYDVCYASIVVSDNVHPVAVCDQNTVVALGGNGIARVYAETFNDGSYDNCSIESIKVRRMHPGWCPPGVADDTHFRNFVEFCCEDIGWLQVVLRVTDHSGNFNECMVNVEVTDNLPGDLHCPPDVTITCDYPFDIWDLSEFGKIADSYYDRDDIYIYDDYYLPSGYVGKDGYVKSGGCSGGYGGNYWVSEDIHPNLDCGQGVIYRTFKLHGGGYGNHVTCTQKIFVKDPDPFNRHDIHFPYDVHIDNCDPHNLSPDVTGRPTFDDDVCSIIATNYKDEVFTIVDGACFKILRTWKVLDWCQYNPYTGKGLWSDVQVIKVKNSEEPTFQSCDDVTLKTANVQGCTGKVDLLAGAMDDCTPDSLLNYKYYIDAFNDGGPIFGQYDITGNTSDASGFYPFGTHRILWLVEDLCGNTGTCDYLFTVEDGKKPSPVCYNGLSTVVMPVSGMIELEAEMFNVNSFDNCTKKKDLIFSFSPDVTETSKIFTCEDRDSSVVEIYVTDEAGNQQFCTTYLTIQDNEGVCPDQPLVYISGSLMDRNSRGVGNAKVHLNALDRSMEVKRSDMDGSFEYGALGIRFDESYRLRASKSGDAANGLSISDLLAMQYHIIGVHRLEDPYQLLAADVDMNKKIDIIDLVEARAILLGEKKKFNHNRSWIFVPEGTEFVRPDYPYDYDHMKEVVASTDNPATVNFTAVKLGDINATARADGNRNGISYPQTDLVIPDVDFEKGEEVQLPVTVRESQTVSGIQLHLQTETAISNLRVAPGLFDFGSTVDKNMLERGIMKGIALGQQPIEVTSEDALFYITFNAESNGTTRGLLQSVGGLENLIVLNGEEVRFEIDEEDAEVVNESPEHNVTISANPFRNATRIDVELAAAGNMDIVIRDLSGKLLVNEQCEQCSTHTYFLNGELLGTAGLYLVEVSSANYRSTHKVLYLGK